MDRHIATHTLSASRKDCKGGGIRWLYKLHDNSLFSQWLLNRCFLDEMFNHRTVNTARSCGKLEKCINCRMNCGWINCTPKTGNYPICHDSLSISYMGNRVHLNSHICINWLKIPGTEHLFYIQMLFSFPKSRQENRSWCLHQLSSLPGHQHAGRGAQGDVVPHHWSYQTLRQHRLGRLSVPLMGTGSFAGLKELYPTLCCSSSLGTQGH